MPSDRCARCGLPGTVLLPPRRGGAVRVHATQKECISRLVEIARDAKIAVDSDNLMAAVAAMGRLRSALSDKPEETKP